MEETLKLLVNEIYGDVEQGEGKSARRKGKFLRTAICPLHCVWCDTAYTWRFNDKFPHRDNIVYNFVDEVHPMTPWEVLQRIHQTGSPDVKSLFVSGGDPMIPNQQMALVPILETLKREGWWVEVENEALFAPLPAIVELVDQFNCSPKLENSGNSVYARRKPEALLALQKTGKANWKFVASSSEDFIEIDELVESFGLTDIYIMPEGVTREALIENTEKIEKLVIGRGWNLSPRLHIMEHGNKRGT